MKSSWMLLWGAKRKALFQRTKNLLRVDPYRDISILGVFAHPLKKEQRGYLNRKLLFESG